MELSPSAHIDTFCRDHLPPAEQWPDLRFDLGGLSYPERLNCAEALLDAVVARFGADRPCLRTATEMWTYGDLLGRANQAARVLVEEFGLVPGNRVLLRGPNNPWLIASWFAVIKAGGVAVTTMALLRAGEITALADITRPSLAICDHRFAAELDAAGLGIPAIRYGGPAADDLTSRCAGLSPASRPSPRPPTTWRCSPRPRAPPASPRPPCTSTATCWRSRTPSAAMCSRRARMTCSWAPRRSASRSGSAAWWCFRSASARARCCWSGPHRTNWRKRSPATA